MGIEGNRETETGNQTDAMRNPGVPCTCPEGNFLKLYLQGTVRSNLGQAAIPERLRKLELVLPDLLGSQGTFFWLVYGRFGGQKDAGHVLEGANVWVDLEGILPFE